MFSVRRGLVAFTCVPLLLVGACGDDTPKSNGSSAPSPSASTSASPSPSEAEAVLPEDQPASEVTPEQVVHAWFEAYNELRLTGAGARIRTVSSKLCQTCESIIGQLEDIYSAGGSIESSGDPHAVVDIGPDPESTPPKGTTRFLVKFVTSAGVTRETKDSQPTAFEANEYVWLFDLTVEQGQWRVREVGF